MCLFVCVFCSPIHDHANSECWLRVVDGIAHEDLYELTGDEEELKVLKKSNAEAGTVCYIHGKILSSWTYHRRLQNHHHELCRCPDSIGLHSIGNASKEETMVSLHCYSPPFDQCHVFLEGTGHGVEVNVTFYSEHGQVVRHEHDDHAISDMDSCPHHH